MTAIDRILADVRRGENIDIYVTAAVAGILVVLDLLGIAPQWLLAPVTLATLAVLALSVLGLRSRLATVLQNMPKAAAGLQLYDDFPPQIQEEIANGIEHSSELLIIGLDLGQTLHRHSDRFVKRVQSGACIKFVLANPDSPACNLSVNRHRGSDPAAEIEVKRAQIRASLREICELRSAASWQVEVRLIDFPIARGGIFVDPDSPTGRLFVWDYRFGSKRTAKLVVRPTHERWYEFYKDEALFVWDRATVWQDENRQLPRPHEGA